MKLVIIIFALSFTLMAAKCTPGASINSASPAWCKTTYKSISTCDMDRECNWSYDHAACKAK